MQKSIERDVWLLVWLICPSLLFSSALTFARDTGKDHRPWIWWEAETAQTARESSVAEEQSMPVSRLSGGHWLVCAVQENPPVLRWSLTLYTNAAHHLFARVRQPQPDFRWRFNQDPWRDAVDLKPLDRVRLNDLVTLDWVYLGQVVLHEGLHTFETVSTQGGVAGFDCFVLTPVVFTPRGTHATGQDKPAQAMPDFWPFVPRPDAFAPSPLDLRRLNHVTAGEQGFVRQRNDHLVFSNSGERARFFGVVVDPKLVLWDQPFIDLLAQRLARVGVNLVRVSRNIADSRADDPATVDRAFLERFFYFLYAMKREGIYTAVCFFSPRQYTVPKNTGWAGYTSNRRRQRARGLVYFHPGMQTLYRTWMREVFSAVNPYTGRSLANEPALAWFELLDQDSLFTGSVSPTTTPMESIVLLEKKFGDWAAARHGSLRQALTHWQNDLPRDEEATGRAGLQKLYKCTTRALTVEGVKRIRDQVCFLRDLQAGWMDETIRWLHGDIGLSCPVLAGGWMTVDPFNITPLDWQSCCVGDILGQQFVFGAEQWRKRSRRSLSIGKNKTALLSPHSLPQCIQYEGKPHVLTSCTWRRPNRFRTEASLIAAAYGAAQGVDGCCFAMVSSPDWLDRLKEDDAFMCPSGLAVLPACALLFRRGDVRETDLLVRQSLNPMDRFVTDLTEAQQQSGKPYAMPEKARATGLDPICCLVGKTVRHFTDQASRLDMPDLTAYIDEENKRISDMHRQLFLDHAAGTLVIDTPLTQGVAGFLKMAKPPLPCDVNVLADFLYGAVLFTSLDDKPLTQADKILLQVMSDESNSRINNKKGGRTYETAPVQVRTIKGRASLRDRPGPVSLTALGPNGYPLQRQVQYQREDGCLNILLEPDVLYYIIER